jgi:hypothetical protein
MEQQNLGRIDPDMDVCDIDGNKVGTVAQVYRYDIAVAGSVGATTLPPRDELVPREEVIEVKTGFLGLGSHLYAPMSAVQDVTSGCVFLSRRKDDFEGLGWHEKPPHLDELH